MSSTSATSPEKDEEKWTHTSSTPEKAEEKLLRTSSAPQVEGAVKAQSLPSNINASFNDTTAPARQRSLPNQRAHPQRNLSGQTRLTSAGRSSAFTSSYMSYASSAYESAASVTWGITNPLSNISKEELYTRVEIFAEQKNLLDILPDLQKGALVAKDPRGFESLEELTQEEKDFFVREITHKWSQPATMYWLVVCCSMAAVVQGMDETVINGANLFFVDTFNLPQSSEHNRWLLGAVNSAPYIGCAVLGCWLTNKYMGRRGTIAFTAAISCLTCIWQALTNSWEHLFIARLMLGIGGIGAKSSTTPVFSAECAPAPIRGAMVMMWQMWTAFGIMLGYVADVAFYKVPDSGGIEGLNWRLMLGSAGLPAIIVFMQIFFLPESPRFLIGKGRYRDAYNSLRRLRSSPIQAAKDLYYIHIFLEMEREIKKGNHRFSELFTIPRNFRATISSSIVMSGQQLCGVNAIIYYSSIIFHWSGYSEISTLLASFGFGLINFVFAIPAIYTIDTFGRRNLLLTTFPLMSLCLLLAGFSFWIDNEKARLACVALGIYLYGIVYSPGEGPVPFTYSAEVFPLYIRDLGMSLATAQTWAFNALLAITFPATLSRLHPQGAFGLYAGFCGIFWILILLLVPESKALTLEELDSVFSVSNTKHASYQLRQVVYCIKHYLLRMNVEKEILYDHELEDYYAETPLDTPRRSMQSQRDTGVRNKERPGMDD